MACIRRLRMPKEDTGDSGRELDTSIRISTEIRERLKALGGKGETYDDIIETLLEDHED